MKKIDIGFENIECIAHIADIHIRNLRRHKEYRQVFRKPKFHVFLSEIKFVYNSTKLVAIKSNVLIYAK